MLSFPTIFANSRRRNIHVPPTPHSPRTLCGRPANPFLRLRPCAQHSPAVPLDPRSAATTRKSPQQKTRPQPPDAYPRTAPAQLRLPLRIFFRISPLRPAPAPSSGPATRPDGVSASSALVPQFPADSPPQSSPDAPQFGVPFLFFRPLIPAFALRHSAPVPHRSRPVPRRFRRGERRKRLRCMSYRGSPRSSLSALRRCSTASLTRSPPCPFPS